MAQDILELNGTEYELGAKAENVSYNNSVSGMTATNVKAALDELAARPQGGGGSGTYAPFAGKKMAVIGDSFTAGGNWFSQMCTLLGATMQSNEALSGGAWHGNDSVSAYKQAQSLVSHVGSNHPDYILIVMGVNDINNDTDFYKPFPSTVDNVDLGTIAYPTEPNGNEMGLFDLAATPYSFTAGVQATLTYLKKHFPNAIIKIGWTPSGMQYLANGFIFKNGLVSDPWQVFHSYIQRLKDLSDMYGVDYIDTLHCGISWWVTEDFNAYTKCGAGESPIDPNTGKHVSDNHPSSAGHARIAQYMARLMLGNL